MRLDGAEDLLTGHFRTLAGRHAEHLRLTRAIDVGVQQADLETFRRQCQRQIGGDGGLADATLAGSDRDNVLDTFHTLKLL